MHGFCTWSHQRNRMLQIVHEAYNTSNEIPRNKEEGITCLVTMYIGLSTLIHFPHRLSCSASQKHNLPTHKFAMNPPLPHIYHMHSSDSFDKEVFFGYSYNHVQYAPIRSDEKLRCELWQPTIHKNWNEHGMLWKYGMHFVWIADSNMSTIFPQKMFTILFQTRNKCTSASIPGLCHHFHIRSHASSDDFWAVLSACE